MNPPAVLQSIYDILDELKKSYPPPYHILIDWDNIFSAMISLFEKRPRFKFNTLRLAIDEILGKSHISFFMSTTLIKNNPDKLKRLLDFIRTLEELNIEVMQRHRKKKRKLLRNPDSKTGFSEVIFDIGDCDSLIVSGMLFPLLADINSYNTLFLFSGDSDFVPVVARLRKEFRKKVIASAFQVNLSYELIQNVDHHFLLEKTDLISI